MSRKELSWLIAALALAFALGAWLRWSALPGQVTGDNQTVIALLTDTGWPSEGPPDADVTMVVFTDYRCPACRLSDGPMRRALAEDGNVRVIYRDWPVFGEASRQAARIAMAADVQGRYVALHERLMRARGIESEAAVLAEFAATGGDVARLKADLARGSEAIDHALARTRQDATTLGVRGTPTYLIGRRRIEGALSQRQFARAFAAAREQAK